MLKDETGNGHFYDWRQNDAAVLVAAAAFCRLTCCERVSVSCLLSFYILGSDICTEHAKVLEHVGITAIVTKVPQRYPPTDAAIEVKICQKILRTPLWPCDKNAELYRIKIFVLYADGRYGR
jgi:hypothetical protein